MAVIAQAKRHAGRVAKLLAEEYPDAKCALEFRTPLQLLIATILSAQCTDVRVNLVTKDLFRRYRTADDFARADAQELEQQIKSTGFFRNKAKNIQACCRRLVDESDGEVPAELERLVKLPGIGRKTANVVLGTAFGIASGVVVDTHVSRLSQRLGLTKHKDPVKIERDLMSLLPATEWVDFSHRMIHHGRRICLARRPKCEICRLGKICPRVGVAQPKAIKTAPKAAKTAKPVKKRVRSAPRI
ncbi:MAG TPA: endonuclease III [Pirellulales bacterium]|nr:endonuclease III [Pirellulales bacterium]